MKYAEKKPAIPTGFNLFTSIAGTRSWPYHMRDAFWEKWCVAA
ncbi:MAG: hypothetical protein ABSA64_09905 [Sedimentisphaerales bacterium]